MTPAVAFQEITPEQASALMRDKPGLLVLDVRTPAEFAEEHISGSVNVDYRAESFRAKVGKLDRDAEYLVYCLVGIRGARAAAIMAELGFSRVYNLAGGIAAWKSAGLPTVK